MHSISPLPLKFRISRFIWRLSFQGFFKLFTNLVVTGKENVPKDQSYIVAYNHVSVFDPVLLVSIWPIGLENLAAQYLWESYGTGFMMISWGAIPVKRDGFDREFLRTTLGVIDAGRSLAMAPEGKRSGTPGLLRAMPGIAYIAEKANVPIIPVGITGTTKDLYDNGKSGNKNNVRASIGKPFRLPALKDLPGKRKEARQKNSDTVMLEIAKLLPTEYQGFYADQI